jgi:MFS family permease
MTIKSWKTPLVVLIAGCLISMTGFGIRSSFGLFLEPMTVANDWSRETFGLAMALQNLLWGIGLPLAGALADKQGSVKVIIAGAIMYALGVWGMAESDSGTMLQLTGGVLTGLGIAFSAFTISMAAMVRVVGPEKRSFILGLGTAAGSFGQVLFSPISQGFISNYGWHSALLILASISLILIPMAMCLPSASKNAPGDAQDDQTLKDAVYEAIQHRGFVLLTTGFFVC